MTTSVYRNNPEPRKTIGYIRVSTQEQSETKLSLEAQRARIAAYCAAMGWSLSDTICDGGASAKTLERPGMATLLASIKAGSIERVVVAKLDRATRSVRDLCHLVELCAKHNVALVSAGETLDTSSAAGRMVVHMLGVVAQWEREAISERTRDALAAKKRRGEPVGRKRSLTAQHLAHAREMLDAGKGPGYVARMLKVSRVTLWRYLHGAA